MNLSNEVNHLVFRTFGDEVIQRSLRAKCRVLAQLKANTDILQTMAWRTISSPNQGYIASPGMVRLIWTVGVGMLGEPFAADVEAAVLSAPDVVLTPNYYQN